MIYTTRHYWGSDYIEQSSDPRRWSAEKLKKKADSWEAKCAAYEAQIKLSFSQYTLTSEPKSVKELLGHADKNASWVLTRAAELGYCKKVGSKYYV